MIFFTNGREDKITIDLLFIKSRMENVIHIHCSNDCVRDLIPGYLRRWN